MSATTYVVACSVFQILLIVLFLVFGRDMSPEGLFDLEKYEFTHLMIFVGFSLLYAFIRRYSWTGVGQTLIIGVFSVEFYLLFAGVWNSLLNSDYTTFEIPFGGIELFRADFCAGAVLVSFGAVFGKVNTFQMIVMAVLETCIYALNEYLLIEVFETVDTGGSLTLHAFGAYFGLLASLVYNAKNGRDHSENKTSYTSNIYAIIGTVLLWVSWPCFNSALLKDDEYYAVVNTAFSLFGCTVAVFITTAALNDGKFSMVSVVNATLAGGVSIGSMCADLTNPAYALICGVFTGVVATWGFERFSAILEKSIGLHDTAGIHNLHGMPGVIGSLFSIIYFGISGNEPVLNQVYGLLCTLALSSVFGAIFGIYLKVTEHDVKGFYVDEFYWTDCNSIEGNLLSRPLVKKINEDDEN